jgi:hypothetical protein
LIFSGEGNGASSGYEEEAAFGSLRGIEHPADSAGISEEEPGQPGEKWVGFHFGENLRRQAGSDKGQQTKSRPIQMRKMSTVSV